MTIGVVDVTGIDLRLIIRQAYKYSRCINELGFLHLRDDDIITDEECDKLIELTKDEFSWKFYLDYIAGRAVKLGVQTRDGRNYIWAPWFDHTDEQFRAFLTAIGIDHKDMVFKEHVGGCGCNNCDMKRILLKGVSAN